MQKLLINSENCKSIDYVADVELSQFSKELLCELIFDYKFNIEIKTAETQGPFGANISVTPTDNLHYVIIQYHDTFTDPDFYHELSHIKLWHKTKEYVITHDNWDKELLNLMKQISGQSITEIDSSDVNTFKYVVNIAPHITIFPDMVAKGFNPVNHLIASLNNQKTQDSEINEVLRYFHILLCDNADILQDISGSIKESTSWAIAKNLLDIIVKQNTTLVSENVINILTFLKDHNLGFQETSFAKITNGMIVKISKQSIRNFLH